MNKEIERKRAIQYVKKEIIALFSIFIYRGGELPTVLCAFPTGVPHTHVQNKLLLYSPPLHGSKTKLVLSCCTTRH